MGGGVTYTFTSTQKVTINSGNGAIDDPLSPNLTRVKYLDGNNNVNYINLAPFNFAPASADASNNVPVTALASFVENYASSNVTDTSFGRQVATRLALVLETQKITIDNVDYYGRKEAYYGFYFVSSVNTSLSSKIIEAGTITVVKYVAQLDTILTEQYTLTSVTMASREAVSDRYNYQGFYIGIPKQTNDLILSISIEYPEE